MFIDHAKGSKIVNVDGNEYIDYVCFWGPAILGHTDGCVIAVVQRACEKGRTFGAPTEKEYQLVELVQELMHLVNSSTEAVMSAIRATRGFTGRNKIIKFRGCYHGHFDGLLVKAVPGVPADFTRNTLVAEYNSAASVETLLKQNGDDVAAIIVEPVAANMSVVPTTEHFLQELWELADCYHTLLIFDEVITGFQLALGGAQAYYNVTPNLTTLGKIVSGVCQWRPTAAEGTSCRWRHRWAVCTRRAR